MEILALQSEMESEIKDMQALQRDMKKLAETRQLLIEQQSESEIVKKVKINLKKQTIFKKEKRNLKTYI